QGVRVVAGQEQELAVARQRHLAGGLLLAVGDHGVDRPGGGPADGVAQARRGGCVGERRGRRYPGDGGGAVVAVEAGLGDRNLLAGGEAHRGRGRDRYRGSGLRGGADTVAEAVGAGQDERLDERPRGRVLVHEDRIADRGDAGVGAGRGDDRRDAVA